MSRFLWFSVYMPSQCGILPVFSWAIKTWSGNSSWITARFNEMNVYQ